MFIKKIRIMQSKSEGVIKGLKLLNIKLKELNKIILLCH
jgi:hypothetical protein